MLDKPCISPDCNPDDTGENGDEPGRRPAFRLFSFTVWPERVFASDFFLPAAFFEMPFAFANVFGVPRFRAGCFGGDFLRLLFFDLAAFFLVFFLVAIGAV